jgi:hypothetical protein
MRLQSLFLLLALVIICEHQCSADEKKGTSAEAAPTKADWDENEVFNDDDGYTNKIKPSKSKNRYKNDDDNYGGNTSDQDDDDDNSYNTKPSYNDDDDYQSAENSSPRKRKTPDDMGHMNIYLREPSKDGKRRKPKRFRFPVARYERRRFPKTFGPLVSFLPWLPIFADRLTKQTIIFSPTGGIYIIPPVINFYGKLISVAQLIASGYASLVSSGAPPPPAVNVAPLVQPGPVVGPGVPTINPETGGFKGGVRTQFQSSFSGPKYPKAVAEQADYSQQDQGGKPRSGGY